MTISTTFNPKTRSRKPTLLDLALRYFAVYLVPALIVIITLVSLATLHSNKVDAQGRGVSLLVLPTTQYTSIDPTTAYKSLTQSEILTSNLNTKNAWVLATVIPVSTNEEIVLQFPSRYINGLSCWNPSDMKSIGKSANDNSRLTIYDNIPGHSIMIGAISAPTQILCHISYSRSTKPQATSWSISQYHLLSNNNEHNMGIVEGGLLAPAILALLIAFVTRENTYALIAAWLAANLRIGAFAMGWDANWIGLNIPIEALNATRTITCAIYYLLTVALLSRLMRASHYNDESAIFTLLKGSTFIALIAAIILPIHWFWVFISFLSFFGLIASIFLISINLHNLSLITWFWQTFAIGMAFSTLLGLSLILSFGDINSISYTQTIIVMVATSIIIVLAIIERVRNNRIAQQRLQTELVTNYAITPIGMFTLDIQDKFVRINPVLERMLGFTLESKPEALWSDYFPDMNWSELDAKAQTNQDLEITSKIRDKTGSYKHFAIRAIKVENTIEGSLQDISAHTALIEQLRLLSGKDPVTEALNQKGFEKAISNAIRSLSPEHQASLAYLNFSHFKSINSLFGYATGDAMLTQTKELITRTLSQSHELGRIGSDEFAILFPNKTAQEVEPTMQKLAASINNHVFNVGLHSINVKTHIGLVDLGNETKTAKEALFAAGRASKDAIKSPNGLTTYQTGSNALGEHRELLRLFDQLESGITPEGFGIEMQPIMSMKDPNSIWGFETLLRVHDSNGKLISAGRLIDAAEDIGPITTIDKWVIEYVLSWLDSHYKRLPKLNLVSINISGISLNSESFTQHLFRLLDRYKHITNKILIEMTESAALQNLERAKSIMSQLQEMGVRVGLDDFGSGYTSFTYLRNLKADIIKIDGPLIHNMLEDKRNIAIISTIVQLAKQLNMRCIAEWVEDIPTLKALDDMGIDYVQGFVVSGSLPLHEILQFKSIHDFIKTPEANEYFKRFK